MKTGRILHQQMMQLRWHFLACLGLLMALPIEEGIINLRDGAGFYASGLSLGIPLTVAPLLAGLIACANVQADLDERRYIFWRSKPIGVKSFMAIKYLVGLLVAFVAIALPIAFMFISCGIVQNEKIERGFIAYVINFQFISLLAYSLCFFCNVLVRKTARAWLIGMAMVLFLLLVPFILPLNFKDVENDFLRVASLIYLSVTLIPALIAFIASLIVASRNWHLRTNLKGLLWTGAALIFLIMLLFTRQVANIKVLDEKTPEMFTGFLDHAGDKIVSPNYHDITIEGSRIKLNPISEPLTEDLKGQIKASHPHYEVDKELQHSVYSEPYPFCSLVGNNIYSFSIDMYYRERKVCSRKENAYEKLYVRMSKYVSGFYIRCSTVDISDFLEEKHHPTLAMRAIDDKLIVFVNKSVLVIEVTKDGEMKLIDKKVDQLKRYRTYQSVQDKEFTIPLVPIETISIEDRVRLSIDLNNWYGWSDGRFEKTSIVDIHDGRFGFCLLDEGRIQRFDVVKWDDEYVYCKFRDARPFTFLEQMFEQIDKYSRYFVKEGKFYAYNDMKMMVFDIRSDRIRKLGHFERISDNFNINDIEVLNDGNILMSSMHVIKVGKKKVEGGYLYDRLERKNYLTLLKNPE